MNQTDKIELSKRVAEKYGIDAFTTNTSRQIIESVKIGDYERATVIMDKTVCLADDSARCFELTVQHNLDIICINSLIVEVFNPYSLAGNFVKIVESYADHADAKEATRIAILKCLDEMKGE